MPSSAPANEKNAHHLHAAPNVVASSASAASAFPLAPDGSPAFYPLPPSRGDGFKRGSTLLLIDHSNDDESPLVLPWARALSLNPLFPSIDITEDEITFGRKPPSQVIINQQAISGVHCRILRKRVEANRGAPAVAALIKANSQRKLLHRVDERPQKDSKLTMKDEKKRVPEVAMPVKPHIVNPQGSAAASPRQPAPERQLINSSLQAPLQLQLQGPSWAAVVAGATPLTAPSNSSGYTSSSGGHPHPLQLGQAHPLQPAVEMTAKPEKSGGINSSASSSSSSNHSRPRASHMFSSPPLPQNHPQSPRHSALKAASPGHQHSASSSAVGSPLSARDIAAAGSGLGSGAHGSAGGGGSGNQSNSTPASPRAGGSRRRLTPPGSPPLSGDITPNRSPSHSRRVSKEENANSLSGADKEGFFARMMGRLKKPKKGSNEDRLRQPTSGGKYKPRKSTSGEDDHEMTTAATYSSAAAQSNDANSSSAPHQASTPTQSLTQVATTPPSKASQSNRDERSSVTVSVTQVPSTIDSRSNSVFDPMPVLSEVNEEKEEKRNATNVNIAVSKPSVSTSSFSINSNSNSPSALSTASTVSLSLSTPSTLSTPSVASTTVVVTPPSTNSTPHAVQARGPSAAATVHSPPLPSASPFSPNSNALQALGGGGNSGDDDLEGWQYKRNKTMTLRDVRAQFGGTKHEMYLEDLSTNGTFITKDGNNVKIGSGNKVRLVSGSEFTLLPRSKTWAPISYVFMVHGETPASDVNEMAPEGDVALVFTDIEKSTVLWETAPRGMNEALEKHDVCMRTLLSRYRGYEVKTEGDAFFIAFFNVLDAIAFCLAVQEALLRIHWPPELLKLSPARQEWVTGQVTSMGSGAYPAAHAANSLGNSHIGLPSSESTSSLASGEYLLWSGVRVRMGIHMGRVNSRRNPVTKRMDYFGPPVNCASRVSDCAHGGQVICTKEVYEYILRLGKALKKKTLRTKMDQHANHTAAVPTFGAVVTQQELARVAAAANSPVLPSMSFLQKSTSFGPNVASLSGNTALMPKNNHLNAALLSSSSKVASSASVQSNLISLKTPDVGGHFLGDDSEPHLSDDYDTSSTSSSSSSPVAEEEDEDDDLTLLLPSVLAGSDTTLKRSEQILITRTLGSYRLKGIRDPVEIFQLKSPRIMKRFYPPLRTRDAPSGNSHNNINGAM